jgi:hypothetical protein
MPAFFSRRRFVPIAIALAGLLLLGTASASAATRFAAPGGTGPAPACTEAQPCSLFEAASAAAASPPPAGTEVVLLPGTYTDTTADLGPNHTISLAEGISLHGAAGQARPVISNSLNSTSAFEVHAGDTVSDLEIQSGSRNGILVKEGTVKEVVVRDTFSNGFSNTFACGLSANATIRDSVCLTTGSNGRAIGATTAGAFPHTWILRNVTAISTGPNSFGLFLKLVGNAGTADAKDVIARGTEKDIEAVGSEAGGSSTITLQNSDFASFEAKGENGGTASVTAPGTNGNITAAALLAADGFHELAGSPTIDTGILDAQSGTTDVDGEERTLGLAPDIGADELKLDPTTTTIGCTPTQVLANEALTCTLTVKDTAQQNPALPTGTVGLHSDHRGSSPAPCTLEASAGKTDEAHCQVLYTPAEAATHELTATYSGDGAHNSSSASTRVTVGLRQSATTLACAPASPILGAGPVTCTATVADPGTNPAAPSGVVKLSATAGGAFANPAGCTLAGGSGGKASCQIAYTPKTAGADKITAAYQGDPAHRPSEGASSLSVTAKSAGAPNTTIKKKPKAKTTSPLALFTFTADQPGASFQCKLDKGAFKPCRSPFKHRVKPGRHSFAVRAVSSAGVADPTPASYRWRTR